MLLLILLLLTPKKATVVVDALSTGAAGCPAGEPAVGGAHLGGDVTNGSFGESTIGLEMMLDGKTLSDVEPNEFVIGPDYALNIQAQGSFKGFLIRLGSGDAGTDTTEALIVSPENSVVQIATTVCVTNENVGGLTHTNNLDKTGILGTLRMDEIDNNMPLDVTVVVKNRDGESIYYYSRYILNAVESSSATATGTTTTTNGSSDDASHGSRLSINPQLLVALLFGILCGVSGF